MSCLTYAFSDYIVNGMGADLINLIRVIHYCIHNNIKFHFLGPDNWQLVPETPNSARNWTYYFKLTELINMDTENLYPRVSNEHLCNAFKLFIEDVNPFEYYSNLLKTIYQPVDHMIVKKNEKLQKFSYLTPENYVSIHIRRGDKTSGPWREGTIITIDEYLNAFDKNCLSYPPTVKYVYVATDTESVIHELKTKCVDCDKILDVPTDDVIGTLPNGIVLIYDSQEIRRDGYVYKLYNDAININDKEDEIVTFMKNIDLLVGSHDIIGSRMSFFFIVAELLRCKQGTSLSTNLYYPVNFYD